MLLLLVKAAHFYERRFMNDSCTCRLQMCCRLASCRKYEYSAVAVNTFAIHPRGRSVLGECFTALLFGSAIHVSPVHDPA
jgi:hypothetical protein